MRGSGGPLRKGGKGELMSLIGTGESFGGHWKPLLAAAAVLGMMLAFASTAAAQIGDPADPNMEPGPDDLFEGGYGQYGDQYSCPGCEPESASDCPDCGAGVGKNAKEIIGGPGGTAGKDDFSAALEAARSHQETHPALAAETGTGDGLEPSKAPGAESVTHEDIHGEPAKIGGASTGRDGATEANARELANEDGDRSQVSYQENKPEGGRGSGQSSVAGRFLGGSGAAILGASIVGTLLMAGFFVNRGSLRG